MKALLLVVSLMVVAMVACGGSGEQVVAPSSTATPIVVPTPVPVHGPILVLTPWNGGVRMLASHLGDTYILERVVPQEKGQETVVLPEGYSVPHRVMIRGMGKEYTVLVGPGKLPTARVVTVPLEEEMRIGPLLEGTTQVIFSAP